MSASKPADMYQGSDWLTYRWPVAQAFDTLDRIRDLCLQMPVAGPVERKPIFEDEAVFDIPDEEIADMFGYIVELCDDLSGELDTVRADLYSNMKGNAAHSWSAFEMLLHLRDLRADAVKEIAASVPSHAPPETILARASRIKALLKQIDQ